MDSYSEVPDQQLDEIEARDPALYEAVLRACESTFDHPERAQSLSGAITTEQGIRMVLRVPGFHPYKVLWSTRSCRELKRCSRTTSDRDSGSRSPRPTPERAYPVFR